MEEMSLEFKSDVPRFLIPIIEDIRGQFQNDHSGHVIFSELHVDGVGELNSANLREKLKNLKGGPWKQAVWFKQLLFCTIGSVAHGM